MKYFLNLIRKYNGGKTAFAYAECYLNDWYIPADEIDSAELKYRYQLIIQNYWGSWKAINEYLPLDIPIQTAIEQSELVDSGVAILDEWRIKK